mmetsp:Transcript_84424/g.243710  ORF Transcript_84424/g.243710 Transcript_84424/m.243710 type:complete len:260 (+) Transcript_84424:585-1364(+)
MHLRAATGVCLPLARRDLCDGRCCNGHGICDHRPRRLGPAGPRRCRRFFREHPALRRHHHLLLRRTSMLSISAGKHAEADEVGLQYRRQLRPRLHVLCVLRAFGLHRVRGWPPAKRGPKPCTCPRGDARPCHRGWLLLDQGAIDIPVAPQRRHRRRLAAVLRWPHLAAAAYCPCHGRRSGYGARRRRPAGQSGRRGVAHWEPSGNHHLHPVSRHGPLDSVAPLYRAGDPMVQVGAIHVCLVLRCCLCCPGYRHGSQRHP